MEAGAGACPRPRSGRAASRDMAAAAANKNLNLVDVYDIAADIGKVGPNTRYAVQILLPILVLAISLVKLTSDKECPRARFLETCGKIGLKIF